MSTGSSQNSIAVPCVEVAVWVGGRRRLTPGLDHREWDDLDAGDGVDHERKLALAVPLAAELYDLQRRYRRIAGAPAVADYASGAATLWHALPELLSVRRRRSSSSELAQDDQIVGLRASMWTR